MNHSIRVLSVFLALATAATADPPRADAQTPRIGSRVRITTTAGPPAELTGRLEAWDDRWVLLRTADGGEGMRIHRSDIARFQLSGGERGHGFAGGIVGLLIGGGIGLSAGQSMVDDGWNSNATVSLSILGAAAGAGLGALIGESVKSERWEDVPAERWRLRIEPDARGAIALRADFRL